MKENEIKTSLEELKKERASNFKERRWFVKYWAEYVKTHSDEDWSRQQNILIDSQIKNARAVFSTKPQNT